MNRDVVHDFMVAKSMFLVVQRLGLIDRATTFQEFVDWMGGLEWYVQVYKPK